MAWRRRYPYEAAWREFEEMLDDIESIFSAMAWGMEPGRLPIAGDDFRVDVFEHEDTVMVVADLPGVRKEEISVRLLDPGTLRISARRRMEEGREEFFIRERGSGTMSRVVRLPAPVTEEGAITSFKNGVLELTLKKAAPEEEAGIPIQ